MTLDRWLAVIGIVGLPVGVLVSWIIARYYYRRADKRQTPTFILQSTNSLAEPGLASITGLSLRCNGQEAGKGGITEAKIYFWNSGTLPILRDQVLEPYTIRLPGRILAHSVLKSSRDVVDLRTS